MRELRSFTVVSLLAASVLAADFVVTSKGIWKSESGELVRQTTPNDRVIVLGGSTPTPGPTPIPPDPNPSSLADRVANWADTVAEPGARSAFAVLYRKAADGAIPYDQMISLRSTLLVGARSGWANVFAQVDRELDLLGRSKAGLTSVAEGLGRASALTADQIANIPESLRGLPGVAEFNWIGIITCLLQHLLTPAAASEVPQPTPDPISTPTPANPPLFKSTR